MSLSPEWTLLVLLAAAMHAGWNVMVKIGDDALLNMTLIVTTSGLLALLAAPFVEFPNRECWPFLVGSIITHMGYYTFLLFGYRSGDLSLVYPIARGSAPMLVTIGSWLLVGEKLSTTAIIGVVAISVGILTLSLDRPIAQPRSWRAVLFGLLTGCTIMGYSLSDGQGVRLAEDKYGYIVWVFVLDAPALVLFCLWRRGPKLFSLAKRHWKIALVGGALSLIAYGIAIYAMSQTQLAQVTALRETSVIFAAIMSAFILKEKFKPRRYGCVALVALGAVLLH